MVLSFENEDGAYFLFANCISALVFWHLLYHTKERTSRYTMRKYENRSEYSLEKKREIVQNAEIQTEENGLNMWLFVL